MMSVAAAMGKAREGDMSGYHALVAGSLEATRKARPADCFPFVAAGFWAHLTAHVGNDADSLHKLGEVKALQASYERTRGHDARAVYADAEALRALSQAADAGNDAAADRLVVLADECDAESVRMAAAWQTGDEADERKRYERAFAAAAVGAPAAAALICAEIIIGAKQGGLPDGESIALLGLVAELLGAIGDDESLVRFATVSLICWRYFRDHGDEAKSVAYHAAAIRALQAVQNTVDPAAAALLPHMLDELDGDTLHDVIAAAPGLRSFLRHEGMC